MAQYERFRLNPEALTRSADAHAGYAAALLHTQRSEYLPWVASSMLLAAVHRILVDPEAARADFRQAAWQYALARSPYAGILAVCAQDASLVERFAMQTRSEELARPDPDRWLGLILGDAWSSGAEDRFRRFDPGSSERDIRHAPVGRIGLPLGLYEQALATLESALTRNRRSEEPALSEVGVLFSRGVEPVRAAMRDRYHWERLYSTVLPVEPELIAVGLAMLGLWRRADRTSESLLESMEATTRDSFAMVPLQLAIDLGGSDYTAESPTVSV